MKEKGLCINCNENTSCTLTRKFPVIYCEEFSTGKNENKNRKIKSGKKRAKYKK